MPSYHHGAYVLMYSAVLSLPKHRTDGYSETSLVRFCEDIQTLKKVLYVNCFKCSSMKKKKSQLVFDR